MLQIATGAKYFVHACMHPSTLPLSAMIPDNVLHDVWEATFPPTYPLFLSRVAPPRRTVSLFLPPSLHVRQPNRDISRLRDVANPWE